MVHQTQGLKNVADKGFTMAGKNKKTRSPRAKSGYVAKTRPSATGGQVYAKQGVERRLTSGITPYDTARMDAYFQADEDHDKAFEARLGAKIRNRKRNNKARSVKKYVKAGASNPGTHRRGK